MDTRHWFEDIADHLGSAYLRYSFTKGTDQEVDFLVGALGLEPGAKVLDVGCGPGRHAHALARRGFEVTGVDISERFVDLARGAAPPGATFVRGDARHLATPGPAAPDLDYDGTFDAVISLCQGAFGLSYGPAGEGPAQPAQECPARPLDPDAVVLGGMARALRPGGRLACSAFSAYFQVRHLDGETSGPAAPGLDGTFDAERGVYHEQFTVKDEDGGDAVYPAWTTCFTPRELRLLVAAAGLVPLHLWSVDPGDYAARPPDLDHAEFLVVATAPD